MNDPNGTIYHDGYYHLFYQHNPFGDTWHQIHWGHARSRDLVHWEHLPIALFPALELGEDSCFSGCVAITPEGLPILLYTMVGSRSEHSTREQWAAVGDAELIRWKRLPDNPVLAVETHDGPAVKGDWRDPYVFKTEGRTFMVVAATLDDGAGEDFVVLLYEATDHSLTRWSFRNILIRKPNYEMSFFECPNFFPLGDRWILLVSPYKPVEYYSGRFDLGTCTFTPLVQGRLDAGMDYYATNTAFAPDGRTILFGWVRGFRKGHGWNGCLGLPRELTVDSNGYPVQRPVRELESLRGAPARMGRQPLGSKELVLDDSAEYRSAEIACTFALRKASAVEIRILRAHDGRSAVSVGFDGHFIDVYGTKIPYEIDDPEQQLSLRIFVDRSVIEVYVDDGRRALTRVVYVDPANSGISIVSHGGEAALESLTAWKLRPITFGRESAGTQPAHR
jgi:beta-fructofuranosidase